MWKGIGSLAATVTNMRLPINGPITIVQGNTFRGITMACDAATGLWRRLRVKNGWVNPLSTVALEAAAGNANRPRYIAVACLHVASE
eukprot:211166-Amphidinium_carterae.1